MPAPAGLAATTAGGHALPARFDGTPAPMSRRRPRRGVVLGILGAVAVLGALGALQVTANLGYDDAERTFSAARAGAGGAADEVQRAVDDLTSTSGVATLLLESDSGLLADPTLKESLAAAVTTADESATAAGELLDRGIPRAGVKPGFFWELFPAAEQLTAKTAETDALTDDLDAETPALATAATDVTESGVAFLGSAATAATVFETAHISAKNDDVIALREAAATASRTTALDDGTVGVFVALQDAAAQVVTSEQVELAEKAGPLFEVRLEIEAFARSLAPGVLLEFNWNPVVNGAGYNGSMGGLTTWWWDDPDRAVIELSNSVAEQWPAERSRALVAHEVGHAISVKCEDMYDSSTQESIEMWATAWAIGMGFTDDANGVWAYGYPPQSYIDASYACR